MPDNASVISHKGVDIYSIINNEVELKHDEYRVTNNTWCWYRKNGDQPLNGAFKIINDNEQHSMMGKGVYQMCFNKGKIINFTIVDDAQIVCWKYNDEGKIALCRVEDLIKAGVVSDMDGAYLKFKFDYHTGYYKNQQNM